MAAGSGGPEIVPIGVDRDPRMSGMSDIDVAGAIASTFSGPGSDEWVGIEQALHSLMTGNREHTAFSGDPGRDTPPYYVDNHTRGLVVELVHRVASQLVSREVSGPEGQG